MQTTPTGNPVLAVAVGILLLWPGSSPAIDRTDAPDTVTISLLAELYDPVEFNHAGHVEMADCSDCHHHTAGTVTERWNCKKCHDNPMEGETVSCSDCHPRDRFGTQYLASLDDPELYHKEKPGLKGAFHLSCVGCHREQGGPTGCDQCHSMNENGERRFNAGPYAPDR